MILDSWIVQGKITDNRIVPDAIGDSCFFKAIQAEINILRNDLEKLSELPFEVAIFDEIQTAKNKDLYKQLCKNPQAELCFNNFKDGVQLRVRGIFQPVEDTELLKQVLEDRPFLKTLIPKGYEVALFRLTDAIAHVWTMKTNLEPKTYIEL